MFKLGNWSELIFMVLLLGFKVIQKNKFLCGLSILAMGGSWNNGAPQPYGENIKNSLNHE